MRNLNECQAEVFRRSEQRIKDRKKRRNHILMVCIPFVLCITLFSATILLSVERVGGDYAAESNKEMFVGDATESVVYSYTEVEIQAAGYFPDHYEKITDKVEITKIFTAVHSFLPEKNGADQESDNIPDKEAAEENLYQTGASITHSGYMITFSDKEGNQIVYSLIGNVLLNMSTNEAVSLTDDQVAELKAALGLTG